MIVFLTGATGSGKTDTAWGLVSALDTIVFLDCDWFASRSPFSWKLAADVESVYRAIRSQISFHLGERRTRFVVTLTLEMAAIYSSNYDSFAAFGLPIYAFRLVASSDTLKNRIVGRDRIQKAEELDNALRQQADFDRLYPDEAIFSRIETDSLAACDVAQTIVERVSSVPKVSN
jgi:hypothetical protein